MSGAIDRSLVCSPEYGVIKELIKKLVCRNFLLSHMWMPTSIAVHISPLFKQSLGVTIITSVFQITGLIWFLIS